MVVESADKEGEAGNFDFDRDEASVFTIHEDRKRPAAIPDDDASTGTDFKTVAGHDKTDCLYDEETLG